ncbi:hypothetical protein HanRHA438_Chr05g0208971 [Helianthus annuus]|uniref:Uncharacterized protein n=1 Tax=Helianthus annuus TaxID=4232 RepID=A0A251ULT4_HELAN|nr:hypothetical protein HanXRQr2_Chr05g0199241 [Helianthus annuus]KAJ0569220.1 hypothetical protein HanHA300_Chr05g0163611 [Helianthus annuus]KAJ0575641.1 hypothetical protein HanIR_Chr05g0215071 [Helianthus annuus]KAJ0583518.1 hypothetical protein HanHA89_Chr05g0177521 [Helianthus annuus]KAJ0917700.1 hypothetical protein HanRHA438_Chr05g0208971 [Helianthus annuus]
MCSSSGQGSNYLTLKPGFDSAQCVFFFPFLLTSDLSLYHKPCKILTYHHKFTFTFSFYSLSQQEPQSSFVVGLSQLCLPCIQNLNSSKPIANERKSVCESDRRRDGRQRLSRLSGVDTGDPSQMTPVSR